MTEYKCRRIPPAAAILGHRAWSIAVLTLHRLGARRRMQRQRSGRGRVRPADGRARPSSVPGRERQRADVQAAAVSLDRGRDRSTRRHPQSDRRQPAAALSALRDRRRTPHDAVRVRNPRPRRRGPRRTRTRRVLPVHQPGPLRPRRHDALLLRDPVAVRFSVVVAARPRLRPAATRASSPNCPRCICSRPRSVSACSPRARSAQFFRELRS